jgi:hypothetical protein
MDAYPRCSLARRTEIDCATRVAWSSAFTEFAPVVSTGRARRHRHSATGRARAVACGWIRMWLLPYAHCREWPVSGYATPS